MLEAREYWLARLVFQRGLALICLIAFLVALNQFRALCGERGLLPFTAFIKEVPYWESPSLFYAFPRDSALLIAAWLGIILSCLALFGISERFGAPFSMLVWASIWMIYLSFVNVGQNFYSFGWESILLEACFLAIFLGASSTVPQTIPLWLLRWLEFRIMFGAGLIKLRGDSCWRDLTCLNRYYETQPIPNPMSWSFHWMPEWTHKGGVLFNHFAELIVPFAYFLPQPFATAAGIITIIFQASIMLTGNLSWLNALTIVLAFPLIDDRFWQFIPSHAPSLVAPLRLETVAQMAVAVLTVVLSVPVVANMISRQQLMNFNYNPLHLVGTYGAFGSITRERYEIVVEGTGDPVLTDNTRWREYQFRGKPTDPMQKPRQIAPYHLRLDWLMWFAAMTDYQQHPWFVSFVYKLLNADPPTLALLAADPFSGQAPHYVRAQLYQYHFATPEEHRQTGRWWTRTFAGAYLGPVSLQSPGLREAVRRITGSA
jgi:hypothetical protein